jgi:hypothetical protein
LEEGQVPVVFIGRQIPETGDVERHTGILCFPGPFIRCQNTVAQEEGKEDASDMSAEMERRILHVVWSDGVTNAEINQRTNTKDIVVASLKLKWKWRGHGPAKMGARCINLGRKGRQREN